MHQINLPIKNLKEFLTLSRFVVSDKNDLLPITKYLKFDIDFGDVTITKDNTREFIKHSFYYDCLDCSFLLPEDKFNNYISETNGEFLVIKFLEDSVEVFDGYKKQKWGLKGNKVDMFPKPSDLPTEYFNISSEIISTLQLSSIVSDPKNEIRPFAKFSYIVNDCIYSTTINTAFKKSLDTGINGLIAVSEKECNYLSQFDSVKYGFCQKFNVWKKDNTISGFRVDDGAKGYDYKIMFGSISTPRNQYVTISTKDLSNFCKSTIKFNELQYKNSLLLYKDGKAEISYKDIDSGEENKMSVSAKISSGDNFEFVFIPVLMEKIMAKFPFPEISICIDKYKMGESWREIIYGFSEVNESICIIFPKIEL